MNDKASTTQVPPGPAPQVQENNAIAKAVSVLFEPGDVVELRIIKKKGYIGSGYYDDHDQLVKQAGVLERRKDLPGIYVTLNQINPALLSRRSNRMLMEMSKKDNTTSDADITRRRWLPIDLDPVRPSGISSSEEEHQRAFCRGLEIVNWLSEKGFPEPIIADSGNGSHLLYRIDLPNDPESTVLVKQVLQVLDGIFSDEAVMVDTANFNAGRIWKLYGTTARKGDDTSQRPHRISGLLNTPTLCEVVSTEKLVEIADALPKPPKPHPAGHYNGTGSIDIREWLREHGLGVRLEKPYQGGTLYQLDTCPFSSAHEDGAYVIQFGSGALFAGCHHNSCKGKSWADLREIYEPNRPKPTPATKALKQPTTGPENGLSPGSSQRSLIETPEISPVCDHAGGCGFTLTDVGNSERLVYLYGRSILHCQKLNTWFFWNGQFWERDFLNKIMYLATQTAKSLYSEAAGEGWGAFGNWAVTSQSLARRVAMVEGAKPLRPILPENFDVGDHLLNCLNGTLELDTMTFREHQREDFLTKVAGVDYDPDATCPMWEKHINLVFQGDPDLISCFQELAGYVLSVS